MTALVVPARTGRSHRRRRADRSAPECGTQLPGKPGRLGARRRRALRAGVRMAARWPPMPSVGPTADAWRRPDGHSTGSSAPARGHIDLRSAVELPSVEGQVEISNHTDLRTMVDLLVDHV